MCNNCQINNCGVLNPSECPINKLWDKEELKDELAREAEALMTRRE